MDTPMIAVIGTDAGVCRAIGRVLLQANFKAEPFPCAVEFLASLHSTPPACAIVDMLEHESLGRELVAALHQHHPSVPIIALTADQDLFDTQLARQATFVLHKPVESEMLLAAVQAASLQTVDRTGGCHSSTATSKDGASASSK